MKPILSSDGRWHIYLEPTNNPAGCKKHFSAKTRTAVLQRAENYLADPSNYETTTPDVRVTFGQWLAIWLGQVALTTKPSVYTNHSSMVCRFIAPKLSNVWIASLQAEQLQAVIDQIESESTKRSCLKTMKVALNAAYKRQLVSNNQAEFVYLPRTGPILFNETDPAVKIVTDLYQPKIQVMSAAETKAVIHTAQTSWPHIGLRYILALKLGIRQSEALGLWLEDLDDTNETLAIRRTYNRASYYHGCEDPITCSGKTPRQCPDTIPAPRIDTTKTKAGHRIIPLPKTLFAALKSHKRSQLERRLRSEVPWPNINWMFTDEAGRPIQHSLDQKQWKRLLEQAGVRHYRLHDARHTAATGLLQLGVDPATTKDIMGWSSDKIAATYQHQVDSRVRDAVSALDQLLG